MRGNNKKARRKSSPPFAVTSFLINLLIFLAVCGSLWTLLALAPFSLFQRDYAIYK
jgi:hypothetical protein